jgi:hypothetical protein
MDRLLGLAKMRVSLVRCYFYEAVGMEWRQWRRFSGEALTMRQTGWWTSGEKLPLCYMDPIPVHTCGTLFGFKRASNAIQPIFMQTTTGGTPATVSTRFTQKLHSYLWTVIEPES